MQTTIAIVAALTLATVVAGDAGAAITLRGAMGDNSETRKLNQLEGSGSNGSIIWGGGTQNAKTELPPRPSTTRLPDQLPKELLVR
ncbi:hypothetical protein V7S43_012868 [Phytophthora oleae]|uniref:RxLR effector protein n=1 Tax=Phytophthora oleae TaxID=2107226 RepID=A0ABD3F5R5_9STRA